MKRALLLGLFGSSLAWAQPFVRTQVPDRANQGQLCVTWNKREFSYVVDAAGNSLTPADSEFVAIDAAFASWQAVSDTCSDFRFVRSERQTNLQTGRGTDSSNAIVFREKSCSTAAPRTDPCQDDGSCASRYQCWDHSDLTIALTTTSYVKRTGAILDADIEFNASPSIIDGSRFFFTTVSSPPCTPGLEAVTCVATDIQNTLTHEIGHALGFDHVPAQARRWKRRLLQEKPKRGSSMSVCPRVFVGLTPRVYLLFPVTSWRSCAEKSSLKAPELLVFPRWGAPRCLLASGSGFWPCSGWHCCAAVDHQPAFHPAC